MTNIELAYAELQIALDDLRNYGDDEARRYANKCAAIYRKAVADQPRSDLAVFI